LEYKVYKFQLKTAQTFSIQPTASQQDCRVQTRALRHPLQPSSVMRHWCQ